MTGRYLEESLTYSNRPELSRRHTRGYRFLLPFLFFLFFFDKLKGVRSGRGGRRERRRLLFSSRPLGIRYDAEKYPGFLAIVWHQAEGKGISFSPV